MTTGCNTAILVMNKFINLDWQEFNLPAVALCLDVWPLMCTWSAYQYRNHTTFEATRGRPQRLFQVHLNLRAHPTLEM